MPPAKPAKLGVVRGKKKILAFKENVGDVSGKRDHCDSGEVEDPPDHAILQYKRS